MEKNFVLEMTKEERECVLDALLIFEFEEGTTKEGVKLVHQLFDKLGVSYSRREK